MATYVIGDIQGCYAELKALLAAIQFDNDRDTLWFTGDLVNRGPDSLAVLRYIKMLGDKHIVVLGNHDLHLLAVADEVRLLHQHDTLTPILEAHDKAELIDWLRHQPLLHHDAKSNCVMTHAGLAPAWDLAKSQSLAKEVEAALRAAAPQHFLQQMYGNEPSQWHDELQGMDRLRCIVNYCTRMRFCYADGSLDFAYKGTIANKPDELLPWFEVKPRANADLDLVFGHWAALNGETQMAHVYALDTGCVWGNCLTAMRLEDKQRFSVSCRSA